MRLLRTTTTNDNHLHYTSWWTTISGQYFEETGVFLADASRTTCIRVLRRDIGVSLNFGWPHKEGSSTGDYAKRREVATILEADEATRRKHRTRHERSWWLQFAHVPQSLYQGENMVCRGEVVQHVEVRGTVTGMSTYWSAEDEQLTSDKAHRNVWITAWSEWC
jgi:hypothetical protein